MSSENGAFGEVFKSKPIFRKPRPLFPKAHYMCVVPDGSAYGSAHYIVMTRDKAGWMMCKYRGVTTRPYRSTLSANGNEIYMADVCLESHVAVSAITLKIAVDLCIVRHGFLMPEVVVSSVYASMKGKMHA